MQTDGAFKEDTLLHRLRHYLPAQAPLKDFVHHNTLHAFEDLPFHDALKKAQTMLGYRGYYQLKEYREFYKSGKIDDALLTSVIERLKGPREVDKWKVRCLEDNFDTGITPRIGLFRNNWKHLYKINLDKLTHGLLFRFTSSYLDQGVAIWQFPLGNKGFLDAIRTLDKNALFGLLRGKRARHLLQHTPCNLDDLLKIVVGDENLYEQYLFDQHFAHPGWSGLVAVLEENPAALLDARAINLRDFIAFELLLEIDALDKKFGQTWSPLGMQLLINPPKLFAEFDKTTIDDVFMLLHQAFEWTYYNEVLKGIQQASHPNIARSKYSFQALFCIDDRECSIRRYVESEDQDCLTYGTPGHFNIPTYFQPEHSKFHTKICPAPVTPKHIIVERESKKKKKKEHHFNKNSHSLITGWVVTQTLGFWSAIKLFVSVFRPFYNAAAVSSFQHMDPNGRLDVLYKANNQRQDGLQAGFTHEEMATIIEGLLKSIGLTSNFAPIIYCIGHGASSVNNTYYAGYDCGACCGRPGSVNARAAAIMGNSTEVRVLLHQRGIVIPETTQFVGGLHDTTRDEIAFFDKNALSAVNKKHHLENERVFEKALHLNAKERSRRFVLNNTNQNAAAVHEDVKLRSLFLFEPRPEYNHATNALCIVGQRELVKDLFLDRRSFLNSYNYRLDPEGVYLQGILGAASPVCGGINLEYYFSRTDNEKLGAGSKLPHNVIGLIGVANGSDGDLRPGLPYQMVEIHDAIRLMMIVEQFPEVVLKTLNNHGPTLNWYKNEWIHLVVIHPESKVCYRFVKDHFEIYKPVGQPLEERSSLEALINSEIENMPVIVLNPVLAS